MDTLWFYHKKTGITSEGYYSVRYHDNKSHEEKYQECDFIHAKNGDTYISLGVIRTQRLFSSLT